MIGEQRSEMGGAERLLGGALSGKGDGRSPAAEIRAPTVSEGRDRLARRRARWALLDRHTAERALAERLAA
jgi:hypothetical protein